MEIYKMQTLTSAWIYAFLNLSFNILEQDQVWGFLFDWVSLKAFCDTSLLYQKPWIILINSFNNTSDTFVMAGANNKKWTKNYPPLFY